MILFENWQTKKMAEELKSSLRLVSQNNHLIWVWMIVSFVEHRVGEGEEVK